MDSLLIEFGGIPFISEELQYVTILSALAQKRQMLSEGSYDDLNQLLIPEEAKVIMTNKYGICALPSYVLLTQKESVSVRLAIERITKTLPEWMNLFRIPIRFYRTNERETTSFSTAIMPQHILLGRSAFDNEIKLIECIVHELSHTWLNVYREISPFFHKNNNEEFILPSGTKRKSAKTILLAAGYAAAAIQLYTKIEANRKRRKKVVKYYLKY